MEKNEMTTLSTVSLLFLKLARETMDDMNAPKLKIETDTISREDGRRFKITVIIEQNHDK